MTGFSQQARLMMLKCLGHHCLNNCGRRNKWVRHLFILWQPENWSQCDRDAILVKNATQRITRLLDEGLTTNLERPTKLFPNEVISMKRFLASAFILAASFCTAGLQAQTRELRVAVPFNFVVGSKQLPPGNYRLTPEPDDVIVIQDRDRPLGVLVKLGIGNGHQFDGPSRLVFHKYGEYYFLSEIRSPSIAMNGQIPRSKLEKQVKAQTQQAALEQETVLIAGN
ncbi:hypothetical protein HNQ77_003867 [Silvibacterium bohemicum]|uniref:Uncharacterized protein n=1 Tax=Silvibacterium bohemicum TaxID=1577686 RepID=A0A841JZV5_9BACT|nr:hypothetical protein [Silvibacterium bohemicum]